MYTPLKITSELIITFTANKNKKTITCFFALKTQLCKSDILFFTTQLLKDRKLIVVYTNKKLEGNFGVLFIPFQNPETK